MEYTVQKLAALAGVSPRTLRYYDAIGLLKPCRLSEAGYRIYGEAEVDALQQILFYRELGIKLSRIGELLHAPSFNRLAALRQHSQALLKRRERLDLLIDTVTKTIRMEEGRIPMNNTEKFEGFKRAEMEENEKKYGRELRERYGDAAVDAGNAKRMGLSEEAYYSMQELEKKLLAAMRDAVAKGKNPEGEEGREIARLHKEWIGYSWPQYSKKAHLGLTQMYTQDERFTAYYDREQPGCAQFLHDAVAAYLGS